MGPVFKGDSLVSFPLNQGPASKAAPPGFWGRINPYELGPDTGPGDDPLGDFWSESGQTLIVPDDPTHCGVSRMQVFAYYNLCFAISPRWDLSGGDEDFFGDYADYAGLLGHKPNRAIASVRNYGMLSNEALIVTADGLLGSGLTQTSRSGDDWPLPKLKLPDGLVPTAIALTSENELALITVWNTNEWKGQLAVVALQGAALGSHTMKRFCQPNEGSWTGFRLLGLIDLPFKCPSSVSAASNGWWGGPSQTNGADLGQINMDDQGTRDGMREGDPQWSSIFATAGYCIVASKLESKVAIVDLSPIFQVVRNGYLAHDDATYQKTLADEAAGNFPPPLSFIVTEPAITVFDVPTPTATLSAPRTERWSQDYYKAYVASEDGNIHIFDVSSIMARFDWNLRNGPLRETGSFYVGKNPTSMCWMRHLDDKSILTNVPSSSSADELNNTFYVACRGDRAVRGVCCFKENAIIYREITDLRMVDPVAVSVAGRGNIVTVADFAGKCLHSFRVGNLGRDTGSYHSLYPVVNGGKDWDYAGMLKLFGYPFAINSANVN